MNPIQSGSKYRHYKNEKLYEIIGFALNAESHEEIVIYKALYHSEEFGENQIWVRPKEMFFAKVVHNGKSVPRFSLVSDENLVAL